MPTQTRNSSIRSRSRAGVKTRKHARRNRHVEFAVPTASLNAHAIPIDPDTITKVFFEMLLMFKLYHWNTHSFSTHKATDELYSKLNENMDRFMEVLLGVTGHSRIKLSGCITLYNLDEKNELVYKVAQYKTFLLGTQMQRLSIKNPDLITIRDEILANLNQFLYLLTLN
jgi:hypothetical protein